MLMMKTLIAAPVVSASSRHCCQPRPRAGPAATVASPAHLRSADRASTSPQLPILVGIDQGFLAAEGIEPELTRFQGGGVAVRPSRRLDRSLRLRLGPRRRALQTSRIDARILVGIDRF